MGTLGDTTPSANTDFLEAAAQLIETGQFPIGGSGPATLIQHTANSLRNVVQLLVDDPEYAKTLGINAQGIAYLHGVAGVLAQTSGRRRAGSRRPFPQAQADPRQLMRR